MLKRSTTIVLFFRFYDEESEEDSVCMGVEVGGVQEKGVNRKGGNGQRGNGSAKKGRKEGVGRNVGRRRRRYSHFLIGRLGPSIYCLSQK